MNGAAALAPRAGGRTIMLATVGVEPAGRFACGREREGGKGRWRAWGVEEDEDGGEEDGGGECRRPCEGVAAHLAS